MKRQLNIRLLLLLAIPTLLVVVAGVLLWRSQVPRIANRERERADAARQAGKLDEAASHLQRYLSYKPADPSALADYGLLLDDLARSDRERRQALPILQQALQKTPGRFDVRRALVNLYLEAAERAARDGTLDRVGEASTIALSYLDPDAINDQLKSRADRAWASLSRGHALEGQSKFAEAAVEYERAIAAADGEPADNVPDSEPAQITPQGGKPAHDDDPTLTAIEAYASLARLRRERLDQTTEATTLLDRMIEAHPNSVDAYLTRARHRHEVGLPGVADDLTRALKIEPNHAQALLEAAFEESRQPRPDPARIRALLRRGVEAHPQDARMYRALALFETNLQQPSVAERVLLDGREATGSIDLAWDLTNLWIDMSQLRKARELKKTVLDPILQLRLTNYLDARLKLAGGEWKEAGKALEVLAPALAEQTEWKDFAARAYYDLGRYYERLARLSDPDDAERLRLRAGESYRRAARLDPIMEPYQVAEARMLGQAERLVGTSLPSQLTRLDLMIEQIRSRPRPTTPEQAEALEQAWAAVVRVINEIEASQPPPEPEIVPVLLAQVDLLRDRPAEARRRLEAARDAHPDRLPIWLNLSRVAEREGRVAEAASLLDEAERRLGDSPDLFAARVRFWSSRETPIARRALAGEAAHIATLPAERHEELTLLLARALERIRDDNAALELWNDLAQRQPGSLGVQLGLFDVAFRVGDDAVMARCVEQLRQAEGDQEGSLWRYAEAGRLVARARGAAGAPPPPGRTEDLAAARARLDEVEARRRDWSRVPLLRAVLAEIEGNRQEAIAAYQRAVKMGERQVSIVSRLVELLYEQKRYEEADAAIRELGQEASQADARLRRIQVENLIGLGERERALEAVRDAIPADSREFRDFVWLGRVYAATGQLEPAERALRRAVELAPQAPEARITLIQFLTRARRDSASVQAEIDRAAADLPADQAALFLARAYELIGRADQADDLFRKALAAKPGDSATVRAAVDYYLSRDLFDAAEPLLRGTIDNAASTPQDRAWARRSLALTLSRPANEGRFDEALQLIQENIAADPASTDEKRARAYILATRIDRRPEAIRAFEEVGTAALRPDDRLILARLHEAEGAWPAARDLLMALVADQKDDPQYLAATLRSLLRHREFPEAQGVAARLEAIDPGSLRTLALRGELLKAQGRSLDEVLANIRAFAARNPAQATRAASLLEQLGDLAAAEALYRDLARRGDQPDTATELAQFLGRHGRGRDGLDVCDTARATAPTLAIAAALGILSSESPVTTADARRVETWIDDAVRTAETSTRVELECQRGILLALEGRREESVALHRRLLEDDPNAAQVLNNLAWILALTGGDRDEALEMIEKAVRINGPAASLLDTRGVVRLARDEANRAVEDFNIAIGSDPQPAYYLHLARARRALGDRTAAAEALDRAVERGLTPAGVDPLERAAYDKLAADLRPRE